MGALCLQATDLDGEGRVLEEDGRFFCQPRLWHHIPWGDNLEGRGEHRSQAGIWKGLARFTALPALRLCDTQSCRRPCLCLKISQHLERGSKWARNGLCEQVGRLKI
uniref:Uncharacterized protein n=1 Tax=Micrurus lemniscatus lemniscatus TaxID=129467 RepID=A0A2D4IRH1_MICLE